MSPRRRVPDHPLRAPAIVAALAASLLFARATPAPAAAAQAPPRPVALTEPRTLVPGQLALQTGIAYAPGVRVELSGLAGDLWSLGTTRARLGLSANVELAAEWTVREVLVVTSREPGFVELQRGVRRTASDFGDVTLGVRWVALRETETRPGVSLRLETRLPTTDETRGVGTNTTDFFSYVGAGRHWGAWWLQAEVGIGILEAPAEVGEQNDVLAYAAAAVWRVAPRWRVFASARGWEVTRRRIPVGTEERGVAHLGADVRVGPVRVDAALLRGVHGRDPDWGFTLGLTSAWTLWRTG